MPLAARYRDHVGESGNCSVLRKTWGPPQLSPLPLPVRDPFFTSENSQPEKNRLVSSGNGANTRQDYSLKLLFCQNIHFKSNKTVQFSGLLTASFLAFIIVGFSGKTGYKCPWLPAIAITSENWGFGRVQVWDVQGFRLSGDYCFNRAGGSGNFRKMFFGNFSCAKIFSRIFFEPENFPEIFYRQQLINERSTYVPEIFLVALNLGGESTPTN